MSAQRRTCGEARSGCRQGGAFACYAHWHAAPRVVLSLRIEEPLDDRGDEGATCWSASTAVQRVRSFLQAHAAITSLMHKYLLHFVRDRMLQSTGVCFSMPMPPRCLRVLQSVLKAKPQQPPHDGDLQRLCPMDLFAQVCADSRALVPPDPDGPPLAASTLFFEVVRASPSRFVWQKTPGESGFKPFDIVVSVHRVRGVDCKQELDGQFVPHPYRNVFMVVFFASAYMLRLHICTDFS